MWFRTQGGNKEELGSLAVSWGKQGREGASVPTTLHPSALPTQVSLPQELRLL